MNTKSDCIKTVFFPRRRRGEEYRKTYCRATLKKAASAIDSKTNLFHKLMKCLLFEN